MAHCLQYFSSYSSYTDNAETAHYLNTLAVTLRTDDAGCWTQDAGRMTLSPLPHNTGNYSMTPAPYTLTEQAHSKDTRLTLQNF